MRAGHGRGSSMLALVQLVMLVGAVQAQATLRVQVPAECGTEAQLIDRLRQAGAQASIQSVSVDLVISQLRTQDYELQLSWSDEHRTLRDPQCAALFDSAVVILAAAMRPAPAATTTPAIDDEKPPALAAPVASPEAVRTGPPDPSLLLGVGVLASANTLPQLSPGAELTLLATSHRFGAALDIHALLPSTRNATRGHAVDVLGLGSRLMATFAVLPALQVRAGPSLMLLMAHGTGASVQSNSGTGVRPGLSLELAGRLQLGGSFWSELALSGDLALLRPSFEIAGIDTIFRSPLAAAWLRLRILHEFY